MPDKTDDISESLKVMLDRLGVIKPNESEVDFRGRVTSTLIGLVGCVQHLNEELKALRSAQPKVIDGGTY